MEKERLCLRCMRKIGDNNACPYCKNEASEVQQAPYLPLKTVVGGKYLVGKRVSTNGDGSTYYGFDLEKKQAVMIRECFPEGEVTRGDDNYCLVNVGRAAAFIDAKAKFTKLWNTLKNITGCSAIVPVLDVFEDLGTAYAISEYLGEGETLRDYLLKNEQGYISWEEARILLMPVLSALGVLHENGIIHGAVSPNSLIVDKDGKVKITDYSIDDVRTKGGKLPLELSDGYAAIEQYAEDGELGPWTDVYGFATVLYRVLIGSIPMNAVSRATNDKLMIPGKFAEIIPVYVINALVNALQILPEDRTGNVELLRDDLSASPSAAMNAAEAYSSLAAERRTETEEISEEQTDDYDADEEYYPQQNSGVKKSTLITLIVSVVVCIAILLAVVFVIKGNNEKGEETSTTETTLSGEAAETTDDDFINVTLPDFRGMDIEEIKANETYKKVLIISTVYEDSDKDKGTVIAQDLPEGTVVSSINKRSITLKVSDGLLVPDLIGEEATKALKTLTAKGFKYVETEVSGTAASAEQSSKVFGIVYYPEETENWEDLPDDRRISATQRVVLYCYGEYTPPTTTEPTTTEPTTEPETEEETLSVNGDDDSEDVIIE